MTSLDPVARSPDAPTSAAATPEPAPSPADVVSVLPGERTAESVEKWVVDVKERLGGRTPDLITTDENAPSARAILEAFGAEVMSPRTRQIGPAAEDVPGGAGGAA